MGGGFKYVSSSARSVDRQKMVETLLDNGNKEWFSDVARMVDKLVVSAFPADQVSERQEKFCIVCGSELREITAEGFSAYTGEKNTILACSKVPCHTSGVPHDWDVKFFQTRRPCKRCGAISRSLPDDDGG
jgi:ribosomal protein S14